MISLQVTERKTEIIDCANSLQMANDHQSHDRVYSESDGLTIECLERI